MNPERETKTEVTASKILLYLMLAFGFFLLVRSLFAPLFYPYWSEFQFIFFGILLYATFFFILFLVSKRLSARGRKILLFILTIIVSAGLLYTVFKVQVTPVVDLSYIIDQSTYMLENDITTFPEKFQEYYSFYTNNIAIAILIYHVFRFGRMIFGPACNYSIIGGLFNFIMIILSIFCLFRLSDIVTDNEKSSFFLKIILLVNPGWLAFVSYYYTDTISLPFALGGALLLFRANNLSENYKKFICLFISGMLFALGFKIRPTSIIILIAAIVFYLYKKNFKNLVMIVISFFLSFLVVFALYSQAYNSLVKYDTYETGIPTTHFLMMGSHGHGDFNPNDEAYTKSLKTHEEKVKGTLEKYRDNLINNGVIGNISLFFIKEGHVFGEGTRAYHQYVLNAKEDTIAHQILAGKWSGYFKGIMQSYNIIWILLAIGGIWCGRKSISDYQLILLIYWFGTMLFSVLWEAHPRHAFSYVPFLILLSAPLMNVIALKWTENKHIIGNCDTCSESSQSRIKR